MHVLGLASFTGMLFRRYSADLTPVLKYIVHQLHNGQTTEIIVLRELIWKMAGIEPLPSLSDTQVAAMAGGPTLRIEAIASVTRGAKLDPGDATLKGPQRLGKSLIDSGLALPLLIQVAQQRQSAVFTASDAHLKSLAGLFDTVRLQLTLFNMLLTPKFRRMEFYSSIWNCSLLRPSLLQRSTPPKSSLQSQSSDRSMAFALQFACRLFDPCFSRPYWYGCRCFPSPINIKITPQTAALALQEQERIANEEQEKRLKAALTAKSTAKREPAGTSRMASPLPASGTPGTPTEPKTITPVPAGEDVIMEAPANGPAATTPAPPEVCASSRVHRHCSLLQFQSPWLPELSALFDDVKQIAPEKAYEIIG